MKNKKTTKKALINSGLSLGLSCAMLLGTTFAWFTDTASTAKSQIQAGTLKVDLLDENNESLQGREIVFSDNEDKLWEPGESFTTGKIYVKNDGDIDIKYKLHVNGINGDSKLLEAIKFTANDGEIIDGAEYVLQAGEISEPITIKATMDEEAGNEYQGLSIENFGITVVATQNKEGATYNTWDGVTLDDSWRENWETASEFTISTAEQFVDFCNFINKNMGTSGKVFKLADNINLGGAVIPGIGSGTASTPFKNTFDGQGHTISNFEIVSEKDEYGMTGLFGQVSYTGVVKNLTVSNAKITAKSINGFVGGITGYVNEGGIVDNCHVKNVYAKGFKKVGGVVGYVQGATVTNCSATDSTVKFLDPRNDQAGEVIGFIDSQSTTNNNTHENVTVTRK